MSLKELAANLRKPEGSNGLKVADFMNEANANFYTQFFKNIKWQDGLRILEVGFGNAKHVQELISKANNINYVGLDYSETMVEEGKKNYPNQTFYHQNILELDLPNEDKFDVILTINTVYFIDDLDKLFNQLKTVLAPGGEIHIGKRSKQDLEILNEVTQYDFIKYSNEEVINAVMNAQLDINKVVSVKDPAFDMNGKTVQLNSDYIIANGN